MSSLSRHKSKGPFSEGPLRPADHESSPVLATSPSLDLEEDRLVGVLSPLDAHRDAIVADIPYDGEGQETSKGTLSAKSSPHAEQAVASPAPMSHRKKTLTTDHEQGGGGGGGDSGRKRSIFSSPFRKRVGKSSPFASLVVPDESILDYLVSTVARWLERLRDKVIRALSPSKPKQNQKKQGESTDEEELAAPPGTLRSSAKKTPRKGARRTTSRAPHRRG